MWRTVPSSVKCSHCISLQKPSLQHEHPSSLLGTNFPLAVVYPSNKFLLAVSFNASLWMQHSHKHEQKKEQV